uniref:Uncharacterized protein n=1 Tax=Trypanosoma vivax (strain Y486) TaxID=1055687 RepID=G0U9P7_TRYVY|nr:hypothetical protein, unlikely [Trypanosoma vivax Y486]
MSGRGGCQAPVNFSHSESMSNQVGGSLPHAQAVSLKADRHGAISTLKSARRFSCALNRAHLTITLSYLLSFPVHVTQGIHICTCMCVCIQLKRVMVNQGATTTCRHNRTPTFLSELVLVHTPIPLS